MTPTPRARPPARAARHAALLALFAACLAADQLTKRIAEAHLAPGVRHAFLGDTVRLELAHNAGAFLSLGAGMPEWLRSNLFTWGVALLVLGAAFVAFRPSTSTRSATAAALVASGGLGNLWDRIATGGWVVDFMNLGIGPLRTGIFNVADLAIVAGVVILAWPERKPRDAPLR